MPAPKGNKNAAKKVKTDTVLMIRAKSADKERWTAAAQRKGATLSAWVTETLNRAAK